MAFGKKNSSKNSDLVEAARASTLPGAHAEEASFPPEGPVSASADESTQHETSASDNTNLWGGEIAYDEPAIPAEIARDESGQEAAPQRESVDEEAHRDEAQAVPQGDPYETPQEIPPSEPAEEQVFGADANMWQSESPATPQEAIASVEEEPVADGQPVEAPQQNPQEEVQPSMPDPDPTLSQTAPDADGGMAAEKDYSLPESAPVAEATDYDAEHHLPDSAIPESASTTEHVQQVEEGGISAADESGSEEASEFSGSSSERHKTEAAEQFLQSSMQQLEQERAELQQEAERLQQEAERQQHNEQALQNRSKELEEMQQQLQTQMQELEERNQLLEEQEQALQKHSDAMQQEHSMQDLRKKAQMAQDPNSAYVLMQKLARHRKFMKMQAIIWLLLALSFGAFALMAIFSVETQQVNFAALMLLVVLVVSPVLLTVWNMRRAGSLSAHLQQLINEEQQAQEQEKGESSAQS